MIHKEHELEAAPPSTPTTRKSVLSFSSACATTSCHAYRISPAKVQTGNSNWKRRTAGAASSAKVQVPMSSSLPAVDALLLPALPLPAVFPVPSSCRAAGRAAVPADRGSRLIMVGLKGCPGSLADICAAAKTCCLSHRSMRSTHLDTLITSIKTCRHPMIRVPRNARFWEHLEGFCVCALNLLNRTEH